MKRSPFVDEIDAGVGADGPEEDGGAEAPEPVRGPAVLHILVQPRGRAKGAKRGLQEDERKQTKK